MEIKSNQYKFLPLVTLTKLLLSKIPTHIGFIGFDVFKSPFTLTIKGHVYNVLIIDNGYIKVRNRSGLSSTIKFEELTRTQLIKILHRVDSINQKKS